MTDVCMAGELGDYIAAGQSTQTRYFDEVTGEPNEEIFMDDFELAFYLCGDCGAELKTWPEVKKHLEQARKNTMEWVKELE